MAASPDVVEVLTADHQVLRELIERLDDEDDPGRTRALYLEIVAEMAAHEAAEHHVVYPALRAAVPAAEAEVHARLGEHEECNELMAEMRGLSPAGAGFAKRASALVLELEAHFAEEEDEIFPRLRAALDRDQLVALAEKVADVKRRAPAFPDPDDLSSLRTERMRAVG